MEEDDDVMAEAGPGWGDDVDVDEGEEKEGVVVFGWLYVRNVVVVDC